MQAFIYLLDPRNTMNKAISYAIVALGIGILFSSLSNSVLAQVNVEGMNPQMEEDEILICVRDYTDNKGTICHIMPIDNIDWYQEISEPKYGQFGDFNDSFSVGLVD